MIRNRLLPALTVGLAAALLGGCVSEYQYRGGTGGDYYYGQPSVEYRDYGYGGYGDPYGGGYGGGYGYPGGGWSGSIGFGSGYGSPYGYGGYGGYDYPYGYGYGGYGYPYGRPPVIVIRHHHHDHDGNDGDADDQPAGVPRRDPDDLRRAQLPGPLPSIQSPRPMIVPMQSPRQERRGESQSPRAMPQRAMPRRMPQERDDGRNPTP
jgi:hypothetical protein